MRNKETIFDIPGDTYINGMETFVELIEERRKVWGVDSQEVLVGINNIPPSDPNCLVYLSIAAGGQCYQEYFRKELKYGGRWINKSYMHHVKATSSEKGTFDYNNNIAYV